MIGVGAGVGVLEEAWDWEGVGATNLRAAGADIVRAGILTRLNVLSVR
jgi:hypothetical protein